MLLWAKEKADEEFETVTLYKNWKAGPPPSTPPIGDGEPGEYVLAYKNLKGPPPQPTKEEQRALNL